MDFKNSFLADVHVFEASEIDENGEVLQSFPFMYDVVLGNTFGQGQESFPVVGSGGRSPSQTHRRQRDDACQRCSMRNS